MRGATLGDVVAHLASTGSEPRALTGDDLDRALTALVGDEARPGSATGASTCSPSPDEPRSSTALFEGPWPSVVARLVREIAEALEHAHRRGILHRDVKPSNVMLTRDGLAQLDRGQVLRMGGRVDEGRAALDLAIAELRSAASAQPASVEVQRLLADALARRGRGDRLISDAAPDPAETAARLFALDEAVELREAIVRVDGSPLQRRRLAETLQHRGTVLQGTPELGRARDDFEQVIALARALAQDYPNLPLYRELLGSALYSLTAVARGPVPIEELLDWLETSVAELERAVELDHQRPSHREKLVLSLQALGGLQLDRGEALSAAEALGRAVAEARRLRAEGALSTAVLGAARHATGRLAEARIALGQLELAAQTAMELTDLEPAPYEFGYAAWYLARCAAVAIESRGGGGALDPELGAELGADTIERWIGDAIALTRRALDAGAPPAALAAIFTDPELEAVLSDAALAAFLAEL